MKKKEGKKRGKRRGRQQEGTGVEGKNGVEEKWKRNNKKKNRVENWRERREGTEGEQKKEGVSNSMNQWERKKKNGRRGGEEERGRRRGKKGGERNEG